MGRSAGCFRALTKKLRTRRFAREPEGALGAYRRERPRYVSAGITLKSGGTALDGQRPTWLPS
jgi:hypothetical protein